MHTGMLLHVMTRALTDDVVAHGQLDHRARLAELLGSSWVLFLCHLR